MRVLSAALCLLALAPCAAAGETQPDAQELKRLSIEELMRIDVTSAARRAEPVGSAAAAVSVVTGEVIRRSGVTTIADAIGLADGVHVARFNNGAWAITARGFNSNTANKLLVMVDGRTVYTPLFSGVFWNVLDYVLEDIDRIEVIRGPGATLWGANAVNGVINIITRHSGDTRGALVNVSAGNEDRALVEARYGGGGATSWRVYGKYADRDSQQFTTGGSSGDPRRRGQAGFRVDGGTAAARNWMLLANAFHSRDELPNRPPGEFTDLSAQARVSTPLSPISRVDVQTYYRREYRRIPRQLTHYINTVDVDAQHSLAAARRHAIVWGGGLRVNSDRTYGSSAIRFNPENRRYRVVSVFAQDEFAIVPQRAFVTAGVKYEHNSFSGGHLQPNLRGRLLLPRDQVLWGAVSRAVRRPTRFDADLEIPGPGDTLLYQGGGDGFRAESLVASQLGYRVRPAAALSLDITAFVHHLNDLRSQEAPTAGVVPVTLGNTLHGHSRGVEVAVNVQPVAAWRTHLGYTWLDSSVERDQGSRDIGGGSSEMNDPSFLFTLRTALDLPRDVDLDAWIRAVDDLPNPAVPGYAELNARLGWRVTPALDIWIAGQDLLHEQHPEFGALLPARVEFERSVRLGTTVRF